MAGRALQLEIDVGALRSNARSIMGAVGPGVQLYACLKGDAYGCGIIHAAPALYSEGVRHFAVGSLEDAAAIRDAGIEGEILLYPNCLPDAVAAIESLRLTITVNSLEEAYAWDRAATQPLPVFIKVDVGALRGGVLPRSATDLAHGLHACGRLAVVGAYAHLHLPDPVAMGPHARHQFALFGAAVQAIRAAGIPLQTLMVSGTAALMGFPEMDLDAVDPGRALFGLGFHGTTRSLALRPVVRRWTSRLLLVKDVAPEDVLPFGAPFELARPMRIGVVPCGWGDGLPRRLHSDARVLVRGRRVPLLPPSHFEHVRVDLSGAPEARFGDEVVLLGGQGDASVGLEEVSGWAGKDPLQFLGTLPRHIERVAVDG